MENKSPNCQNLVVQFTPLSSGNGPTEGTYFKNHIPLGKT